MLLPWNRIRGQAQERKAPNYTVEENMEQLLMGIAGERGESSAAGRARRAPRPWAGPQWAPRVPCALVWWWPSPRHDGVRLPPRQQERLGAARWLEGGDALTCRA